MMLTPRSGRSAQKLPRDGYLYLDVARRLRRRVEKGSYPPGSKLPSLADLCAEFDVSAITVRNALRELMQERLVVGRQGLGVFVKPRAKIHRVLAGNSQRSIGEEIARAGYTARIEELSYVEIKADAELSEQLRVRSGARLFRHEKLTFADDEPVALHAVTMVPALARKLRADLGRYFLFPLLVEHGIATASMRCEFRAVGLGEREARLMELPPGYPMLQVRYTPIKADGAPALSGMTIARSDRFSFEVDLPQKTID
jgi:DNA-binding GntR family transcriptional regulator